MKTIKTLIVLFALSMSFDSLAQLSVKPNGKFATINGLKLYYEETGKGTPLILMHHFFATTTQWDAYVPELSKKYRVINIDLPGHGRSDYMDTTKVYLHERAAEYIIGLIDQLKLDSVYFMGASSGSFIGNYIATMRPNLVKRLILIGTQIYYSKQMRETIIDWWKSGRLIAKDVDFEKHGKVKAHLLSKQFYNFRQLYGDPSFTPDVLQAIKAKTLIIHGDNDFAPVSNAWELHQNIPNSHLWIVPQGGHVPLIDNIKYKNEYTSRILEFLNGDWD